MANDVADELTQAVGSPPAKTAVERRHYPRYSVNATAEVLELQSGTMCRGRMSDLSLGGCYLDTTAPFPVAAAVRLRVTTEKRKFETKAVVVNSQRGMGMGLMFTAP